MFRFRLLVVAFVVLLTTVTGGASVRATSIVVPLGNYTGSDGIMQAAVLARAPLNLRVAIVEECSNEVETGQVTRSEPGAGTRVAPGSDITLFVSKGSTDILRTRAEVWNDCITRAFDATNPRAVLREINKAGVGCTNARDSGRDRLGGRYITCMIGKQPIIIRAWPSFTASQTYRTRIATDPKNSYKCLAISLVAPRYQLDLNAIDGSLSLSSELVLSLRRALNLPINIREGKQYWVIMSLERGNRDACGVNP